ncbi:GTP cyclohydrolase I FolE2 [bacterium]|nr:GTP cyclohydrolase I FolE2 [bacterium]
MKDVQNSQDNRNVDIQKVGIKHVELPLVVQRKNKTDKVVYAKARVCVSLPKDYKGTHMSRFVEVLNEWRSKKLLGVDIRGCLEEVVKRLDAQSGELEFDFKYFVDKQAPVSNLSAPMCYDCSFEGRIDGGKYKFILGVKVPVTTLCPCSKEISEYGAHNQRAIISVKVSYDETEHIWLEDLIELIESCASCPVYPLLKRQDEKYVTEKAWENPKFVEDVLRDTVVKLRENSTIKEFEVDCEAFESIHNHSAWAYQSEIK